MFDLLANIHLPLIGLLIGVIVGLTGVGGGSDDPNSGWWARVSPAIAVGTDLLFAAITKSFGALAHWRVGNVAKRLLTVLIIASEWRRDRLRILLHGLKPNIDSLNRVIRTALGFALFATALALLLRPWLLGFRRAHAVTSQHMTSRAHGVCGRRWCWVSRSALWSRCRRSAQAP